MEEVKRFCNQTTMKGVPRILRNKSISLRALWLAAVLGFLSVSLYQVWALLTEYFKYKSIIKISENLEHALSVDGSSHSPEFNFCNLNALTSDLDRYNGFPTFRQYRDIVDNLTACANCTEERKANSTFVKRESMTLAGYYRFIGPNNASKVGHDFQEFIQRCWLIFADGVSYKKKPCEDLVTITPVQSPDYFRCYNVGFNTSKQNRLKNMIGITFIFYLDNFEIFQRAMDRDVDDGDGIGVHFSIHSNGLLPTLLSQPRVLTPGTAFNIDISAQTRRRLPPPHGECDPNAGDDMFLNHSQINKNFSSGACILLCLEGAVLDKCGCLSAQDIDLAFYLNSTGEMCGDLKLGFENALEKLKCAEKVRESLLEICVRNCPKECLKHTYNLESTESIWPRKSKVKSFYEHYIKGSKQEKIFSSIESINETRGDSLISRTTLKNDFHEALDFIHENYVKCTLTIKYYIHIVMEDTVKTSTEVSLSQLGGTLNLWSGISAIVGIEVLEFIYRIIVHICCSKEEEGFECAKNNDGEIRKENIEI